MPTVVYEVIRPFEDFDEGEFPDTTLEFYPTKAEALNAADSQDKIQVWTVRNLPKRKLICALLTGKGWTDGHETIKEAGGQPCPLP